MAVRDRSNEPGHTTRCTRYHPPRSRSVTTDGHEQMQGTIRQALARTVVLQPRRTCSSVIKPDPPRGPVGLHRIRTYGPRGRRRWCQHRCGGPMSQPTDRTSPDQVHNRKLTLMVLSLKNSVSSATRQCLGESGLPCVRQGIPITHLALRLVRQAGPASCGPPRQVMRERTARDVAVRMRQRTGRSSSNTNAPLRSGPSTRPPCSRRYPCTGFEPTGAGPLPVAVRRQPASGRRLHRHRLRHGRSVLLSPAGGGSTTGWCPTPTS